MPLHFSHFFGSDLCSFQPLVLLQPMAMQNRYQQFERYWHWKHDDSPVQESPVRKVHGPSSITMHTNLWQLSTKALAGEYSSKSSMKKERKKTEMQNFVHALQICLSTETKDHLSYKMSCLERP